ncbi:MAG: hypothetical protein L6R36_003173 [Xanthoria steineri]|nr:MAG: hypothetical protein L6R36_003173 [Xanthoria steineri]
MKTIIKFLFAVPTIFVSHSVPFTPYLYAGCYTDTKSPRALAFSPVGQNRQSMTVEKCAAVCKGNNFRYAGLEYYGECYCGNSIQGTPAADDACTFQCTGNKTQTCGGNNLISVYMDPTYPPSDSSDILTYTPQGCYTEGYNGRAVAFQQSQLSTKNLTTKACLSTCKSQNFPLAATEYGSECYCGAVLGNGTASAPDTECSTRCAGDSADFCGGRSRLNLYVASDLMSTEPCSPFVLPPPTVKSSTTTSSSQSATFSTSDTGTTTTTLSSDSTSSTVSSAAASTSTSLGAAASSSMVDANTSPSTFSEITASATPTPQVTQATSSDLTTSDSSTSQTPLPHETTSENTLDTTTDESSQSGTTTSTTSDISTTDTATSISTSTSSSHSSALSSASSASDNLTSENTIMQSTSSTSSSTSTTSSSITSQTTTTTNSLTSTTPTTETTTSSTKCISTATPTPRCEYGCGKWCSKPIPIFSDHAACKVAVAECILQITDCFLSAGWPASLQCAKYQSWCQSISTYCGSICPGGKCSKKDCISRNPPLGGPTTTSSTINACPATSTTASSTSSSTAPIPTVSSICVLPSGPSGSGYNNGKCVGGIQPPALTCNNIRPEFAQFPLKLYTSKESSQCAGYSRNAVVQACRDACGAQYNSCIDTYATSCKGQTQSGDRDSYDSARGKCTNQYYDCLAVNRGASIGNRCMSFGQGWS